VSGVSKVTRVAAIVIALVLIPSTPLSASPQSRLERTRRDLRTARARLSGAIQTDGQILGLLNTITHRLRIQQSLLAAAQLRLAGIDLGIRSTERRMAALDGERRSRADIISRRARALYIMGPADGIDTIEQAGSVEDFYGRASTIEFVVGYDRRLLEDLASIRNEADLARAALTDQRRQAADARNEIAQRLAVVDEAAQVQQDAHSQLSSRIAGYRSEVAALQRDESNIEALIAARTANSFFPGATGRHGFAWPTLSHHINSPYGPRWGGFHTGIDLQCNTGQPALASKAGRVIAAEWGGGYGNMIIVDHGGGYTSLYAHLSGYYAHQGQIVNRRQRIGACGSTGNATGAHLHFEIRVNGRHVNPRPYLP
jgi:murein DD-endopeptidase MepM/ murein hydrolase activator NlpD